MLTSGGVPRLVYSDVDGVDRAFEIGREPVLVGRSAECTIRSEDPRMSRVHARFFTDGGTLWIEDLGSANGVYVGFDKISRSPVPAGELVLVGSIIFQLVGPNGTIPPPMGVHGTLAQWLALERKARIAVEEERDAFAQRVGEIHAELDAEVGDALLVVLDHARRSAAARFRADLAHGVVAHQLLDDRGDRRLGEAGAPRDLGARQRFRLAHEIQDHGTVDLPGSAVVDFGLKRSRHVAAAIKDS